MKLALVLSFVLLGGSASNRPAQDDVPLKVVTSLPHLAWIAEQVGGDRVETVSLGRGYSDPHRILATPNLMQEVAKADLFVEVGMSLELWVERVLNGARNANVRRGAVGHVFAGRGVPVLQVPANVTRAQGDVHPEGNPHVWLNPLNVIIEGQNIADVLTRLDPAHAAGYAERQKALEKQIHEWMYGKELCELMTGARIERYHRAGTLFEFLQKDFRGEKLASKLGGWLGRMYEQRGMPLVVYHRMWPYFEEAFGVKVVGEIEEKPGVEPSAAHLETLVENAKLAGVKKVIHAPYYPQARCESIAERMGARAVTVPTDVAANDDCPDYPSFISQILDLLLE
ncbi:MAG: metal ABC transporter substrate-binding protein [Planctomycetota bacterium]